MIKVSAKLEGNYRGQIKARYQGHALEIGVNDKPHKGVRYPVRYGSYEGGPVRRRGAEDTRMTMADLASMWGGRFDIFRKPFRGRAKSPEIKRFLKSYGRYLSGRGTKKEAQDRLAAVVRIPIIKKRYGRNSASWARVKGFNRLMVDTGQFLRSIKARITRRSNVS